MAYYVIKDMRTGKPIASSTKEEWMQRVALNGAKVTTIGCMAMDAACARAILKSNMKGVFKVVGVGALGGRFAKLGKDLVEACVNYEIVRVDEDAETETPDEETETTEETPEADPEVD